MMTENSLNFPLCLQPKIDFYQPVPDCCSRFLNRPIKIAPVIITVSLFTSVYLFTSYLYTPRGASNDPLSASL